MKRFWMKPVIYTGADALDALKQLSVQRTLVVTDAFWVSSGGIEQVVRRLSGQVRVFDGVTGEPNTDMIAAGVALFRDFRPEALVALGGGSVLDCAKGIRKFALPEGEYLPLWAIPTTAGTGSEVTSFAVIAQNGVKLPLVEDDLLPDAAILSGSLLTSLPGKALADTAVDALSHALEAIVSTGADAFSDAMALGALERIWHNLIPGAKNQGETPERETLLIASCMAGVAFNSASLGVCHALSHAIGGRFHVPHGKINGVLLPAVVRLNAGVERRDHPLTPAAEGYARAAKTCGLTSGGGRSAVWALIRGIERLRVQLGMPATLSEAGIDRTQMNGAIPELASTAFEDICLKTNPIPLTKGELEGLLRQVAG